MMTVRGVTSVPDGEIVVVVIYESRHATIRIQLRVRGCFVLAGCEIDENGFVGQSELEQSHLDLPSVRIRL